jgi:hypothetical protein
MKENYVIAWEGSHALLSKWGQLNETRIPTLDISALVAARKASWESFVRDGELALEIADNVCSDYKYIIAGGILLAMNAPKAKFITDELGYEIKKFYEKNENGKTLIRIGAIPTGQGITLELKEKTIKWFVDNGIGERVGDDIILNEYIVHSMVII